VQDSGERGVKILRLDSPPANVLSREVIKDLLTKTRALRGDDDVDAVVLASGRPGIFSAGLNINEMHKPDPEALRAYLSLVQDIFLNLYAFPKPIVAAVGGAAPAGGCWLALMADYRVGVDNPKATIGLNETRLGIIAPFYFAEPLTHLVGHRVADRMLQLGALISPQEALKVGLLDELAASPAEAETTAARMARRYADVPSDARTRTKLGLRRPLVERLHKEREQERESFAMQVCTPSVQGPMGRYLDALHAKRKPASVGAAAGAGADKPAA
jgi:3,2-trans-enoyl-CoA isomerase